VAPGTADSPLRGRDQDAPAVPQPSKHTFRSQTESGRCFSPSGAVRPPIPTYRSTLSCYRHCASRLMSLR